jgi:hypothetical protein
MGLLFKLHRDSSGKKESGVEDRGDNGSNQKDIEMKGGGEEVGRRARIWELTWLECFGVVLAIHPRMARIKGCWFTWVILGVVKEMCAKDCLITYATCPQR